MISISITTRLSYENSGSRKEESAKPTASTNDATDPLPPPPPPPAVQEPEPKPEPHVEAPPAPPPAEVVKEDEKVDDEPRQAEPRPQEPRRAAPPVPRPNSTHRYSSTPSIEIATASQAEESSEDDSSDDDSQLGDDDDPDATVVLPDAEKVEERKRREAERQRVLEAAGLIIKIEPSDIPRPTRRRPPPSVPPARRPQSTISLVSDGGGGTIERPLPPRPSSALPSPPLPAPPPRSPSPEAPPPPVRVEDAFDRYEKFKKEQLAAPSPAPTIIVDHPHPSSPSPPPPPASPISSLGGGRNEGGRLSQLMTRIKTSAEGIVGAPTAVQETRRPISLVIGSPMPTGGGGGGAGGVQRTSSPAMGSNWSSMVGDANVLSSIEDKERKRQEAMFEFISTEGSYVRDCQLIVEVFYANLMNLLDDKELVVIFANIEDILISSTTMLSELEERQKASRLYLNTIADILAQHIPNVDVYVPYCVQQGTAIRILQSLRENNPTLASQLISLRQQPTVRGMDLSTFLLAPMQRITRYPLLIKQILHYTEPGADHEKLEYAIGKAEAVLSRINEAIRSRENLDRLAALSADLWVGEGRLDLTAPTRFLGPRVLVKEGALMKNKGGKRLHAILTNDLLVLTEPSRNLYRMPLPLNEISVRELPSNSLAFQLVPRFRGDLIALKAGSAREAMDWMTAIEGARRACVEGEKRNRR